MSAIFVENISKKFKDIKAVNNISFTINPGEVVGFLGPNGAGKTTTMRMLTTFLKPTDGTAKIKGFDIIDEPIEVRKNIGYLPENAPLYDEMGVYEYLEFAADLRNIPGNQKTKRIKEVIERCGLKDAVYKFAGELSKGYRQRLCLAQALIHNPDIMILDEPTSGLDPKQIIEIRELIKEIGREKTIILSTHIMQEVTACCSKVIIINRGNLIAEGTANELSDKIYGGKIVTACVESENNIIEENIAQLSAVKKVSAYDNNNMWYYDIVTDDDLNVRKEVFKIVKEKNLILTELLVKESGLEDVFLKLIKTSDDEGQE